jgi:23S rRNA pseudoU1915 N3-methylase RlmH
MKFYSEKLDKMFDTEKALLDAEKAAEKAAMEKNKKAEAKKAEAKVVEDAFKARNAARLAYNKNIGEAKNVYTEGLKALRSSFDAAVVAENKKLDEAEKAYDAALKEFIAKHPEGYHMTLKDGDNVITLHSDNKSLDFSNAFKMFDLMDSIFRI